MDLDERIVYLLENNSFRFVKTHIAGILKESIDKKITPALDRLTKDEGSVIVKRKAGRGSFRYYHKTNMGEYGKLPEAFKMMNRSFSVIRNSLVVPEAETPKTEILEPEILDLLRNNNYSFSRDHISTILRINDTNAISKTLLIIRKKFPSDFEHFKSSSDLTSHSRVFHHFYKPNSGNRMPRAYKPEFKLRLSKATRANVKKRDFKW